MAKKTPEQKLEDLRKKIGDIEKSIEKETEKIKELKLKKLDLYEEVEKIEKEMK